MRTLQSCHLQTIPRNEHRISRQYIDKNALKILYRLHKSNYQAYLVGGCLRDLLLGKKPKDFDITTDAKPEQIKQLFKNCRLIGRRFRLAHIIFGHEIIEVATLRGHPHKPSAQAKANQSGRLLRDNVFGNLEEDIERRDFTINALYYDIKDFSIRCLPATMPDLEQGIVRLIGDPITRYQEDPVRMLRAIRFAIKLDMTIEDKTAASIQPLGYLLDDIHPSRMYEEVAKLFFNGKAQATWQMLESYQLLPHLFPLIIQHIKQKTPKLLQMINELMCKIDEQVTQGQRVSHSFFYACLLWYPLQETVRQIRVDSDMNLHDIYHVAIGQIFEQHNQSIAISKRCCNIIREMWLLQLRFEKCKNTRAFKLETAAQYKRALNFLDMRSQIEQGHVQKTATWWKTFSQSNAEKRKQITTKKTKTKIQKN